MNRVAEVNRELRLRGVAEKLTAGKGYYYFRDGNAVDWRQSSVMVYRASDLPLERWLEEYESLSGKTLPERLTK